MSDDHVEISNLIARYAELLNMGQVDEVAELFRHGRITSAGRDTMHEGSEAIAAWYRESVHFPETPPDTLLFTSNLQIHVDGDSAESKAYFLAMHKSAQGLGPILAGRYHDEFRRIDGRWWFHHRHMLPDLVGDVSSHVRVPVDDNGAESEPST
jgi:ketosteroid isomerase-like protein